MEKSLTRKEFIRTMGIGLSAVFLSGHGYNCVYGRENEGKSIRGTILKGDAPSRPWKWSIEGFHYRKTGKDVQCLICPNMCYLEPGDRSVCRSKVNIKGKLFSLTYGNPCTIHTDPIEKKPLNHFYPGTEVFSIATTGCNLRCLNCQNWEISQQRPEDVSHGEMFPSDVIERVTADSIPSIAFTYSEAITYYEYMYDTARLAHEKGVRTLFISNGYINEGPLTRLAPYISGANINLKSFDDRIYRSLNGGTLGPVLNTLKTLHRENVWFEITTLVVPTYVDDPEMIKRMCGWILKELGPDYPLHFSRFFPQYKLNRLPATPVSTLDRFRDIALKEGIHYVYVGNVPGHEGRNTFCHNCGALIITRKGYLIDDNRIVKGRCKFCGTLIPGRWPEAKGKI